MTCDVCGKRFAPDEAGQQTAETIMCGECTRRVKERSAELVRQATDPAADDLTRVGCRDGKWFKDGKEIDPHAPDLGGEAG